MSTASTALRSSLVLRSFCDGTSSSQSLTCARAGRRLFIRWTAGLTCSKSRGENSASIDEASLMELATEATCILRLRDPMRSEGHPPQLCWTLVPAASCHPLGGFQDFRRTPIALYSRRPPAQIPVNRVAPSSMNTQLGRGLHSDAVTGRQLEGPPIHPESATVSGILVLDVL